MSKLNVSINTDPKNRGFSVTLNNQMISNVQEISAYQELDGDGNIVYVGASIYVFEKLDDDTVKRITYYSSGSEKAEKIKKSTEKVYTNIEGFVGCEEKSPVSNQIMEFFEKNRRYGV
ncbi:hypothetical protein H8D36_06610 [archaeon]|nr:hypothetical protein [archaeon]